MKSISTDNGIFQLADAFVNQTRCNIFLTGKAGTGKTTFLQHIRENTGKKNVVVAPTGVAAINAGGMTIHSFFQLPIGTFIPVSRLGHLTNESNPVYSHTDLLRKIRINTQKRKLIQQLELLIIDEISMVRADVLDAVDAVLRHIRKNRHTPFGGVQVLMIGDLYQLPPVVTGAEKPLLAEHYENPYFFSARVISKSTPVNLELDKIYRQHDETFIDLLNKIRHGQIDDDDLSRLNKFYKPDFRPGPGEKFITLCSHHYKANAINERELAELPGKAQRFEALIEGEFNENAAPADRTLHLKKGAQVMFIRNDKGEEKRYFNGKIGTVSDIDKDEIRITFEGEDEELLLEEAEWENIRYSLDESTGSIIEKQLGTFRQLPVRLAWAITIHKSQGLTFDRAIIDAGDSFTSGQVYVAFSRLKGLEGLILHTPIRRESIISDMHGMKTSGEAGIRDLKMLLEEEQKKYIRSIIIQSIDWSSLNESFLDIITQYRDKKVSHREETLELAGLCLQAGREMAEVAEKFERQLSVLFAAGDKAYPRLADRVEKAVAYFTSRIKNDIAGPLNEHYGKMEKRSRVRKYLKALQSPRTAVNNKILDLKQAGELAGGLAGGMTVSGLLTSVNDVRKKEAVREKFQAPPQKPKRGDSRKISLEMFKNGKNITEIAEERLLTKGTIESHLLHFITSGDLDVSALVHPEKFKIIKESLFTKKFDTVAELKYILGDKFSYNEIRAVMHHIRAESQEQR